MPSIVYKAKNEVTEEIYIGVTSKSLEERIKDHLQKAQKGTGYVFQQAISTYGPEVFKWEQIDTGTDSNDLAAKERSYILEYSSNERGYNADSGGGIRKIIYQYDIKTKKLIGEFDCLNSAASAVNATKQDISRACLGSNGILKGYFWSYNNSEIFIANGDSRKKRVVQLDMNKKFIAEFSSVAEASKNTGLSKTCIARVCREERSASGGFIWKYEV